MRTWKAVTLTTVVTLFFGVFFIYPVLMVIGEAFYEKEGGLTLAYVGEVFSNPVYVEGIWNALMLGITSTLASLLIAFPLALMTHRYGFPLKGPLSALIFVRGTTEAINLVAQSFLRPRLNAGDEILLTEMEHHANIIPWQLVANERGATVKAAPITDDGVINLESLAGAFSERTRLLAISHVSNVLGTVNPVKAMVAEAHQRGVPVLVDGAQAVPHGPVNVRELDADFYTFSGHKVYAPDGIGVLYGKAEILEQMGPYQGGGDMIERVRFSGSTFRDIPERFEAGTPNISAAIGLASAFDYLESVGWERIIAQEQDLLAYANAGLRSLPGLEIHGPDGGKAAVVSFSLPGIHPHDIGTFLDRDGIAIRVGHHCAQPLMDRLGVSATTRALAHFLGVVASKHLPVEHGECERGRLRNVEVRRQSRKGNRIEALRQGLLVGQDQTRSRTAEALVGAHGHQMGSVFKRLLPLMPGDHSAHMGRVVEKPCAHLVRDLPNLTHRVWREIETAGNGDQLGADFPSECAQTFQIDGVILGIDGPIWISRPYSPAAPASWCVMWPPISAGCTMIGSPGFAVAMKP